VANVLEIPLCPGPIFTRRAGKVTGTNVPEWQWAQGAMFGYYYADFMRREGPWAIVLTEAQYTELLINLPGMPADFSDFENELLGRMGVEFRRDHARGGPLRPDILGFAPKSRTGSILLELLEVTTAGQATKTLREDVQYKLGKFQQIIAGLGPTIEELFSLASYDVTAIASPWRPSQWQRIVPLPLRQDPVTNTTYVEWICFEPTFRVNPPIGVDGLLLYEIHFLPIQSVPKELFNRLTNAERQNRLATRTAYGQTLTPWLTGNYLHANVADRQALQVLAGVLGVGLLVLAAVYLWPAIAGIALDTAIGLTPSTAAGASTAVTEAAVVESSSWLSATISTSQNVMTALGRTVLLTGPFSP
jgi:hypothetical protein